MRAGCRLGALHRQLAAATAPPELGPPQMALPSGVEPWPEDWMPVPTYTHVPRFALSEFLEDGGAAFAHLEEEGFVVLKEMLQQPGCSHVLDLLWTELEGRGAGIVRGQPETWGGENGSCSPTTGGTATPSGGSAASPSSSRSTRRSTGQGTSS